MYDVFVQFANDGTSPLNPLLCIIATHGLSDDIELGIGHHRFGLLWTIILDSAVILPIVLGNHHTSHGLCAIHNTVSQVKLVSVVGKVPTILLVVESVPHPQLTPLVSLSCCTLEADTETPNQSQAVVGVVSHNHIQLVRVVHHDHAVSV